MIKLIKKLFGSATPTTVDSKPKHKHAGNSRDRRRARRADERRAVESSPHTSFSEADGIIKFLHGQIRDHKQRTQEYDKLPSWEDNSMYDGIITLNERRLTIRRD